MADVFTFLNDELNKFKDNGIYESELCNCCLKINKLLNFVEIEDYDKHLDEKERYISREINNISGIINESLFLDLSIIVDLLYDYQRDRKIKERDHYYHSIQCFLLAITLIGKFFQDRPLPTDIAAILFSLTMYHDIGYLYRSIKTSDNKSLSNLFCCNDDIHAHEMGNLLCLPKRIRSKDSMASIVNEIRKSEEIKNIWELESSDGQDMIRKIIGEKLFMEIKKESHAYYGALLLAKAYKTKKLIMEFCEEIPEFIVADNKDDWFIEIIKAVGLHGIEAAAPLFNLENNFYSTFLMIIDELQTYGRRLSDNTNNVLINPKDVGFHWHETYSDILVIDMIRIDTNLKKKYNAHSYEKIYSALSKKIDKESLSNIWNPV